MAHTDRGMFVAASWLARATVLTLLAACQGGPAETAPPLPTNVGTAKQEVNAACGGNARCIGAQRLSDMSLLSSLSYRIKKYDGGPLCADNEANCQRIAREELVRVFEENCSDFVPNDRPPLPTGVVFQKEAVMYQDTRLPADAFSQHFLVPEGSTVTDLDGNGVDEVTTLGETFIKALDGGTYTPGTLEEQIGGAVCGASDVFNLPDAGGGVLRRADIGANVRALGWDQTNRALFAIKDDWSVVALFMSRENRFRVGYRSNLAAHGTTARGIDERRGRNRVEVPLRPHSHLEVARIDGRTVLIAIAGENPPKDPGYGWDPSDHPFFYMGTPDWENNRITWRQVRVIGPNMSGEPAREQVVPDGRRDINVIDSFTLEYRRLRPDGGVRTEPEIYIDMVAYMRNATTSAFWGRCRLSLDECRIQDYTFDRLLGNIGFSRAEPGQTSIAVAESFDYKDPSHRTLTDNHNTVYIKFKSTGKVTRAWALDWGMGWRRMLATGFRPGGYYVPNFPRNTSVATGGGIYAGDFFGRKVEVEKLMNNSRHVIVPTAGVPRIEVLLLPPPYWLGLQDLATVTLDATRATTAMEERSMNSTVANGTSYQMGGGLRAGVIGNLNYTHDEEETRTRTTTESTQFNRTRTISVSATSGLDPIVLTQFMCSDDFWYRVKRGTIPQLNANGEPQRGGSGELVRTPLLGGEQFMMVQVPRRTGAFFRGPTGTGFAAQPAQEGEVSPIHRNSYSLDRYNEIMLNLGQQWRQVHMTRMVGFPPSYWRDDAPDNGEKVFYDIEGRRVTTPVAVLGSRRVPEITRENVSWSVDTATDTTVMRTVMTGTTLTTSDRIHGELTLPVATLGSPSFGGGYGWTHSRGTDTGNGRGTGNHDGVRFAFSWNGWRRQVLTQAYQDPRDGTREMWYSAEDQRRAVRETGGYRYGDRLVLRTGETTREVAFTDSSAAEHNELRFLNLLLDRLTFTATAYAYRYNKDVTWRLVGGPFNGEQRTGNLNFEVVDYLVRWSTINPPPGEVFFHPLRRRNNFRVGDLFCDFLGNRVIRVRAIGADNQAIYEVPDGGKCYTRYDGSNTFLCRETRDPARPINDLTHAECLSRPEARRREAPPVVRPKSTRAAVMLRSGDGDELFQLCTAGRLYVWDETLGDYDETETCAFGCNPEQTACETPPAPVDVPELPPEVAAPSCEAARELACTWESDCCVSAGTPWQTEQSWGWWCEALAEGVCELTEAEVPELCGDGIWNDETEHCDDGNTVGGDDCPADCQIPLALPARVCGNGILEDGEDCDDGNTTGGDECRSDCQRIVRCGDGFVEGDEQCDDGDGPGDGCTSLCRLEKAALPADNDVAFCGDGTSEGDALCVLPAAVCGDGIVELPEACDDGNDDDTDSCDSSCAVRPWLSLFVGPGGEVEVSQNGDVLCSASCTLNVAPVGDIRIRATSVRKVIPFIDSVGGTCTTNRVEGVWVTSCTVPITALREPMLPVAGEKSTRDIGGALWPSTIFVMFSDTEECGDGFKSELEDCDDGNMIDGDGCNTACQEVPCHRGEVVGSELSGLRASEDAPGACSVQPGSRTTPGGTALLLIILILRPRLRRRSRGGA